MSIAVIEYINVKKIFNNFYNRGCFKDRSIKLLYDWILQHGAWNAFEFHLQRNFPTGTDMDEYEGYILNHAKEILDDLKGE